MRFIVATLVMMNLGFAAYHWLLREAPAAVAKQRVEQVLAPVNASMGSSSVARILLLNEVQSDASRDKQLTRVVKNPVQQPVINALVGSADASADAAAEEQLCQVFGPLADLFTGQALVEKLKLYDMRATLQAIDQATGDSDYRVVIPPAKTPQDAFRKLRELKASSIDSYVITQGPEALGISLGLFSSQMAARTASTDFDAEGYETQVIEIPRLLREFWAYGETSKERLDVDEGIWEAILIEYPEIGKKMRVCLENNPSEV
jgi:hypothetical protein